MADILIRGMEMPDGCHNCGFSYFDKGETNGGEPCTVLMCSIINQGTNGADYDGNRPSWCPLLPLPEGNGRLIDADALQAKFELMENALAEHGRPYSFAFKDGGEMCAEWWTVQDALAREPTIIEAEGGNADGN